MIRSRNKAAENWLREKSDSAFTTLAGLWRGRVQDTIADGFQEGHNPRRVGLELAGRIDPKTGKREGGSITLDASEKNIIGSFEKSLVELKNSYFEFDLRNKKYDRSMHKAIRDGRPFPAKKIQLLVNQFEARILKQKADLIAQTEMLSAISRSRHFSIKAAIEKSDLPESAVTRVWDSCGDDRVRPSHRALDGQSIVGFEECFVSPVTGARLMYPGDRSLGAPDEEVVGCRCRVRYDIAFGMRSAVQEELARLRSEGKIP